MLDLLKLMSRQAICWTAEGAQGTVSSKGGRCTTKKLQGQIWQWRGGRSWELRQRDSQPKTSLHMALHHFYGFHNSTLQLHRTCKYMADDQDDQQSSSNTECRINFKYLLLYTSWSQRRGLNLRVPAAGLWVPAVDCQVSLGSFVVASSYGDLSKA